jgi:hypothetical protein
MARMLDARLTLAGYRRENIEIRQKTTLLKRPLDGGYYTWSGVLNATRQVGASTSNLEPMVA